MRKRKYNTKKRFLFNQKETIKKVEHHTLLIAKTFSYAYIFLHSSDAKGKAKNTICYEKYSLRNNCLEKGSQATCT